MLNTSLYKCNNYPTQFLPYLNVARSHGACPSYKLRVEGEGSTFVKPDIAVITLGAFTEDKELQLAQQENAEFMNNIIEAVKAMGVSSQDIQTQSYTIIPLYDYIEGEQIFRGYRVSHTLRITIKDINRVGEIVDVSVAQGANIVNDITFTISDYSMYYKKALTFAINDAISKAISMGNTLSVNVSRIPISIVEKNHTTPSPIESTMLKALDQATPIQGGQIKITAVIEAIFIYLPKK